MILTIVLDGLRPEQITKKYTPNICRLVKRGVLFLNHHATFPTHTRVNVASLVTGCYPGRHGLVGNTFYLPHGRLNLKVDTSFSKEIKILDEKTEGNALHIESLGEILGKKGYLMASVNIGSSGNAYLNNHKAGEFDGLVIHPHFTIPHSEAEKITNRFGTWPSEDIPNSARVHHATTILLEHVIPKYDPTVAFLGSQSQIVLNIKHTLILLKLRKE